MIDSVSSSPAIRKDLFSTIPPKERIAISVVPPPISMIICPRGSSIGSPAPIAAAIGSSTRYASRAPAWIAASDTARLSTSVTPEGIPIITRGLGILAIQGEFSCTCLI